MKKTRQYLVCHNYIEEVDKFLSQFFNKYEDKYTHEDWRSFEIPGSDFSFSLMDGKDQDLTQNIVFEISCDSLDELEQYASKYDKKVESFNASSGKYDYKFYYIEISGPHGICKVDISFNT